MVMVSIVSSSMYGAAMATGMSDKCRIPSCLHQAEPRPRYEGYCSLTCLDIGEYETEIAELKARIKRLEVALLTIKYFFLSDNIPCGVTWERWPESIVFKQMRVDCLDLITEALAPNQHEPSKDTTEE